MTNETQIKDAFDNPPPPPRAPLRERIVGLAALDPIDYLEARKAAAKEYDIPASELDRAVKRERGDADGPQLNGEAFTLTPPEPWPHPVSGCDLANEMRDTIARYAWLEDGAAEVVTLWILHTHVFDAWRSAPRLFITSPEKGCGKSTLLNSVLGRMVCKPLLASNLSTPVFFRAIAQHRPCLLIDEADSFIKRDEELRGAINSSHSSDGGVLRCEGDNHEIRRFSTWAPVALAGIGRLPDTIEDRSIVIQMRRRTPSDHAADITPDALAHFETLARKAAAWCEGLASAMARYVPGDLPPGMNNRLSDNWCPLLTIADELMGGWPERAREIARARIATQEETSVRVQAIMDIDAIFERDGANRLASSYIAEQLAEMEDRPWPEWGRTNKPITVSALARLLRPFGITAIRDRNASGAQYRGYDRAHFSDALARYAGPQADTPGSKVSQCHNQNKNNGLGDFQGVTTGNGCDTLKSDNPLKDKDCDTVTLCNGGDTPSPAFGGVV